MTKQLCRADVLVNPDHLVIIIKWTKAIQQAQQGTYIILPALPNSTLCPRAAFMHMKTSHPAGPNGPLFTIQGSPVTQNQLRQHLTKVLTVLNIDTTGHSFHTFRRSGATLAFNLNVDMQQIKRHGTWRSDSVYTYVVTDSRQASGVAASFRTHLAHTS